MEQLLLWVTPAVYAFLVLYGGLSDLSSFRIPNWVSIALVALFGLFAVGNALAAPPGPGFTAALWPYSLNLLVGLAVFALALVFWLLGKMGGGDVKYLSAAALWAGPQGAALFFLLVTVLTVVLALVLKLMSKWSFLVHAGGLPVFAKRLFDKVAVNQLPYGFPIGLAALAMIPVIFGL